jgi:hypothetical protein
MSRTNDTLTRLVFLSGSILALGLLTLSPGEERGWGAARAEPLTADGRSSVPPNVETPWVEANPTAYREPQPTSPTCSSWDVSPVAMEAILDEMVRRGWRPPTQGEILASLDSTGVVEAEDPEAPLQLGPARSNPLLNGAEPKEEPDPWETEGVSLFETDVPVPVPSVVDDPALPDLDAAIVTPAPAVDPMPAPVETPEPAPVPPAG